VNRLEKQAANLRGLGLTQKEIGEYLGLSRSRVAALLNDPGGVRERERKDSYRGVCVGCGKTTTGCDGRKERPLCPACAAFKRRKWTEERVIEALQRASVDGWAPVSSPWLHAETKPEWAPDVGTVQARFGSWNAACEVAGLKVRHRGVRTPEGQQRLVEAHRRRGK
jgi:transcriptional regulator with XRE-family HTH domain